MAYRIELWREEYTTLCWLAERGYDGSILDNCTVDENGPDVTLELTEAQAWEVNECVNDDPDAFLTCNGDKQLARKLQTFLNSIV